MIAAVAFSSLKYFIYVAEVNSGFEERKLIIFVHFPTGCGGECNLK